MSARPTCQSLKLLRAEKCGSAPQGTLIAMQSEDVAFFFSSFLIISFNNREEGPLWQTHVGILTVVLSALTGTSYISLRWLSRRLCWEWAWMIWLKVFLLSCLGGRAGGWLSIPSGDLTEPKKEEEGEEKSGTETKRQKHYYHCFPCQNKPSLNCIYLRQK